MYPGRERCQSLDQQFLGFHHVIACHYFGGSIIFKTRLANSAQSPTAAIGQGRWRTCLQDDHVYSDLRLSNSVDFKWTTTPNECVCVCFNKETPNQFSLGLFPFFQDSFGRSPHIVFLPLPRGGTVQSSPGASSCPSFKSLAFVGLRVGFNTGTLSCSAVVRNCVGRRRPPEGKMR